MSEVCGEHKYDSEDFQLCPFCEIERFRTKLDKANKRIEELERELKLCEEELYYPDKHGCHIFTNAEIDAAWKMVQGWRHAGASTAVDYRLWMMIFAAFGIVACEECGGSGSVMEAEPTHVCGGDEERCHRCCPVPVPVEAHCPGCAKFTGHGWVRK